MIETELTGQRSGDTVLATESTLRATVTAGIGTTLRVIKNREVLEEIAIAGDPFVHELEVEAPLVGEDRYRHEVADVANRPLTVTSYVWLRRAERDECPGDCDGSNRVGIGELVVGVNIWLGAADISRCRSFDRNSSGGIEVNELVVSVQAALHGCL